MTDVDRSTHIEIWHCEQPEKYRVLREYWWPDATPKPIREVYEVEPVD